MEVFREFRVEAAHQLTGVPPGHPCAQMHGHSWSIEVRVAGPVDPTTGWVVDFAELEAAFAPLHRQLDHHCLNQIEGLENPTSEVLAQWIWRRLRPHLPGLAEIVVRETAATGCSYRGD